MIIIKIKENHRRREERMQMKNVKKRCWSSCKPKECLATDAAAF